ncbi:hypothetical protein D3C77_149190 [compost metagenome]
MRGVVRIDDKLTSGGVVITAAVGMTFLGRAKVSCPLPGHGVNAIAEGDDAATFLGRPIALHGHRCQCGCLLISSLPQAGRS